MLDDKDWTIIRARDLEEIHEVVTQVRLWYEVLFLMFCVYFGWNIGGWLA
jgi:hypothetical protein